MLAPLARILCALLVLLSATLSRGWAIAAHFEGSQVVVQEGAATVRVEAKAETERNYITVHAVTRKGPDYYVLYGISFYSRGYLQPGHCGSGLETSVRWLHLRGGAVVEQREGRQQSCLQNRVPEGLAWSGQVLEWSAWGKDETPDGETSQVRYRWSFNLREPEKGIVEEKQPYALRIQQEPATPAVAP